MKLNIIIVSKKHDIVSAVYPSSVPSIEMHSFSWVIGTSLLKSLCYLKLWLTKCIILFFC
jgi:hypothetical protein